MQETDWRRTLEVVVKGLVGAVLALAGLWVLGWVLSFIGGLLLGIAGIVGALLRFLIPVAAIAGLVYYLVAQVRPKEPVYSSPSRVPSEREVATDAEAAEPVVTTQGVETPVNSEQPEVAAAIGEPAAPSHTDSSLEAPAPETSISEESVTETPVAESTEPTTDSMGDETSPEANPPKRSKRKSN